MTSALTRRTRHTSWLWRRCCQRCPHRTLLVWHRCLLHVTFYGQPPKYRLPPSSRVVVCCLGIVAAVVAAAPGARPRYSTRILGVHWACARLASHPFGFCLASFCVTGPSSALIPTGADPKWQKRLKKRCSCGQLALHLFGSLQQERATFPRQVAPSQPQWSSSIEAPLSNHSSLLQRAHHLPKTGCPIPAPVE